MRLSFLVFASALAVVATTVPLQAADGDLDGDFGDGGLVTRGYPFDGQVADVRMAIEPGGAILTSTCLDSDSVGIVRFEADGTADSGYGSLGGRALALRSDCDTWDGIPGLLLDAEGRLLVVGFWTSGTEETFVPRIARLTAAGDLDTTFDGDGYVEVGGLPGTPSASRDFEYRAAELDGAGRILIAGLCTLCTANSDEDSFVLRLLPSGAPDGSFGNGGWRVFDATTDGDDLVYDLEVDHLDRVYALGSGTVPGTQPFVARLTATGALDGDWGEGGVAFLAPFDVGFNLEAMAWDWRTGGVVLASSAVGSNGRPTGLTRTLFNGDFNTAFGDGGFVDLSTFDEGTYLHDLEIQSDGKIVAVGTIDGNGDQAGGFFLARVLPDGELDDSYDGNGVKRVEFDRTELALDEGFAVALTGGRLVAAGRATAVLPPAHFGLLRTESALVFTDGFELGSTWVWSATTD